MRYRAQLFSVTSTLKVTFICLVFLLFIILLFRSSASSSSYPDKQQPDPIPSSSLKSNTIPTETETETETTTTTGCRKAPPSLANALIHYATTNITPQQTLAEISVSARVLEKKSPCNFLVFGLGHDSLMWSALNYGGRTVFLEEDKAWIEKMQERVASVEAYHVVYESKVKEAEELMRMGMEREECRKVSDPRESKCERLAHRGFPREVYEVEWDVIMVDAPTGYFEGAPGRMSAIYTAALMARNREQGHTHVFVHDVDRMVEDSFSMAFLCQAYLTEQQGRIRHFTIPSHRTSLATPFCPPN